MTVQPRTVPLTGGAHPLERSLVDALLQRSIELRVVTLDVPAGGLHMSSRGSST
jgi:hypothetical protein